jgi:cellulose synthase/poly-beta-1,6-N-acetylglucosamine synthase-like glycosyltransferase
VTVDLTAVSYFVALVVAYYVGLFVFSRWRVRRPAPPLGRSRVFYVILIPARNEELVIEETLRASLRLRFDRFLLVVMNDGSTDRTSEIARSIADPRIWVVDRDPSIAGRGLAEWLLATGRLADYRADEVVVGILDADGRLDPSTLETVSGYFADPRIGSVQVGVQIGNARDNLLSRLQDMEFVAFTFYVQVARQWLGSSGLGGNGQFNRLSALQSLGTEPWAPASLTEDLDLGLRLVRRGWRTEFCERCFVFQQGLTSWRPLMRQRTRWIQGHYQCWKHIPGLASSGTRLRTKVDLIAYLLLVVTVVLVSFQLACTVLAALGIITVTNSFLSALSPEAQRAAQVALALAPISALLFTYQRYSRARLRWWELPTFGLVFTAYSYVWIVSTVRAWGRMLSGRWSWTKTPRIATAVTATEGAA